MSKEISPIVEKKEEKSSVTALEIILMANADREKRPELAVEGVSELDKKTAELLMELPENDEIKKLISDNPKQKYQRKHFRSITFAGSTLQIAMRKLLMKQQVEQFIKENNGEVNIIMLGAGFDFLPLLIHKENPNANFIELDMEATSNKKQEILKEIAKDFPQHSELGANLEFLSCTLGKDDIKQVLDKSNFDKNKPSLIVAEGVLEFVGEKGVSKLFESLNEIVGANSKVVFSIMAGDVPDFNGNETGKFLIEPKDVPGFMAQSGVLVTGKALHHYMQMHGRGIDIDKSVYSQIDGAKDNALQGVEEKLKAKLAKHASITNAEHFFVGEFKQGAINASKIEDIALVKIDVPKKEVALQMGK